MRFLNPKTDFAFKKIFGSETSRDILLSFLNAVLGLEHPYLIREVDILDPYLAPKIIGMKDTYLDVRVKDEKGRSYIIEMQVLNVAGFEKRVLYNACKAYVNQIQKGEEYTELCEVIAITITDFVMFAELEGVQNRFRMRAEENPEIYHSDLELIFIELPKFTKVEEALSSTYDKWLYFLKHARDLTAIPAKLSDELAIVQAFGIANKAGLTDAELEDQERREIFIQDQRGALQLAEQRGEQRGEERGEERGRLEGRLEVARNLLARGMGREEVALIAGVDLELLPQDWAGGSNGRESFWALLPTRYVKKGREPEVRRNIFSALAEWGLAGARVERSVNGVNVVDKVEVVETFLAEERRVKFAYLFGSLAWGDSGPLSDLDLAVYLDGRLDFFTCRLKLMEALAKVLKTEKIDLVVLNNSPIVLTHEVIKAGIVLKDDRPRRVMFESRALRDYLDTAYLREVQRGYLREQIKSGNFFD